MLKACFAPDPANLTVAATAKPTQYIERSGFAEPKVSMAATLEIKCLCKDDALLVRDCRLDARVKERWEFADV